MNSKLDMFSLQKFCRKSRPTLVFFINVDWYFLLHWMDRAIAARKAGWEVCVVTCVTDSEIESKIMSTGIDLINIPISRNSMSLLVELRSAIAAFRVLRAIDVTVLHSITIKPNLYSFVLSRLLKIPTVMSFPGLGALRNSSILSRVVWGILRRLSNFARERNVLVATFENYDDCRFSREKGVYFYRRVVIPGAGVDLRKFPFLRSENRVGPIRVLFGARLLKSKGLLLLVKAIENLIEDGFSLELLVAGIVDESHRDSLTSQEIKFVKDRPFVEWLGKVEDMPPVFDLSDIVCLPTIYGEGVPRILIEGAACGKPLIATDVPGCRDIVEHEKNGILCIANDVDSLMASLERLISSASLRCEFGLNGRILVEHKFSNSQVLTKTLNLYQSLIIGGGVAVN